MSRREASVTGSDIDAAGAFQVAIEVSPIGVLVVDAEGTIVLVNRELERQFGYGRDELVGQAVDLLLPEALRPIRTLYQASFIGAPESRPMDACRELLARHKDGSLSRVEIRLNPLRMTDGVFVLASVAGTTERRRSDVSEGATLEEQLEFERFVAELSGQFINLPSEEIADAIRKGLCRICEQTALDRSVFYKMGGNGTLVEAVSWTAPGIPPAEVPVVGTDRFPWSIERIQAGELVVFSAVSEIPGEIDRGAWAAGTRSAVVVPLSVEGSVGGAVAFHVVRAERTWSQAVVDRLTMVASVFGEVLARQRRDEAVRAAAMEARRLKDQLQVENVYLRREARERLAPTPVVGRSAAVRRVLEQIEQVAATDATVLLLGETGTGKELFATQIHELGSRQSRAMVRVNCGAIPTTLIESELFGREKGAFTGALSRQVGRFELANHSTIFLDEIGDLPIDVQVKLLRVLEERRIERLGSAQPIPVDTRIIAATHRNLEQRISEGTFREDLYYRLNVFPIHVPPLRQRVEDIPLLVWRFVEEFSKAFGKRVDSLDNDNVVALQHYPWPGNIRELRNVVERAMILTTSRRLMIPVPLPSAAAIKRSSRLTDVEREHIRAVLEGTAWRIRGAGGAAERLGLKPTTLETRMAKLGVKRPGHA
jgi:formate hydrogenlyase transcriptional activator